MCIEDTTPNDSRHKKKFQKYEKQKYIFNKKYKKFEID